MERNNYRAAVCLNNYGASLLERGQYRQAAIVLRDSLSIMNAVLQNGQSLCVSEKLHYATKCMAEMMPVRKTCATTTSNVVHVFRYDGAGSLDESLYNFTNAITIEDFDNDRQDEQIRADMDIHTAIIVYNTAMSRLLMASKSRKGAAAVTKACVKLLQWANAILSRALDCRPREATQLSALILGKLVKLLHDAGDKAEALKAGMAHKSMKDTFQMYESLVPSRPDLAAAA